MTPYSCKKFWMPREAMGYVKGESQASLRSDGKLARALVHILGVIGEAATMVSEPARTAYPQIPWGVMKKTRNRVVHGYFSIDCDRVWNTVVEDFPPLVADLEKILASIETETKRTGPT